MPFSPFNVYNYTKYPLTNEKTQLQKLILLSFYTQCINFMYVQHKTTS